MFLALNSIYIGLTPVNTNNLCILKLFREKWTLSFHSDHAWAQLFKASIAIWTPIPVDMLNILANIKNIFNIKYTDFSFFLFFSSKNKASIFQPKICCILSYYMTQWFSVTWEHCKLWTTCPNFEATVPIYPTARSSATTKITYFIPCWKSDSLLVLQMIRSAHCTMTMETKNAVWHVYSNFFLW